MTLTISDILSPYHRTPALGTASCLRTWVFHQHIAVMTLKHRTSHDYGQWENGVTTMLDEWPSGRAPLVVYDVSTLAEIAPLQQAQHLIQAHLRPGGRYAVVLPISGVVAAVQPFFPPASQDKPPVARRVFFSRQGALIWLAEALL